jgi:magnesium transporter
MVINCAAYKGGCRIADIDLEQARELDTSDGRFVWIGLHEPDQALLRTVQQRFGLHDLAIEDALLAHQRPKLEIYGDTLFIVARTASLHDQKLRCAETHIFAGRGYVVTVRHGSTTAYREVRARCEGAPKMLAMGEGFVVYSIMDFIVRFCRSSKARSMHLRMLFSLVRPIDRISSGFLKLGTNYSFCGARCSRCRRFAIV